MTLSYTQVQICTLPSLATVYTVSLLPFVMLVASPSNYDDVCLIEGKSDTSPTDAPSTLRLRSLTETQPEARLFKLLHKRLYAEAEEFCLAFCLNPSVVLKSKVVALLDRLSNSEECELTCENLGEVLRTLKTSLVAITDVSYVVDCCISATPPDLGSTLEFLILARTRLIAAGREDGPEMARVLDASHRLGTFQVVFIVLILFTKD